MNGIEVIQSSLAATRDLVKMTLGDFSDAELLIRPVPNANHAAWQIGNIIGGDIFLIRAELPDAAFPELPEGFMDRYGDKGTKLETTEGWMTKAEYFDLLDKIREASIAAVGALSDADLDRPTKTEKFKSMMPTLGSVLMTVSHHALMHAGQFSVIRRKLGKPILM